MWPRLVALLLVVVAWTSATAADADQLPNLRVSELVFGHAEYSGSYVGVTFENSGDAVASPVLVRFYASRDRRKGPGDTRLRDTVRVARLRPGERMPSDGLWIVSPVGAKRGFFVLACIDPGRRVRERDERDNCRSSRRRARRLV